MNLNEKSFAWWVQAIFAPVGVSCGTLALASMAQGMIEWRGPLSLIVNFWNIYIAPPFIVIATWLLEAVSLPPPPNWLVDYFIFGILIAFRYLAVWITVNSPQVPGDTPRIVKFFQHVFVWPYTLIRTLRLVVKNGVQSPGGLLLLFGPIILFFGLWGLNTIYV
jgi:hypothetical protein